MKPNLRTVIVGAVILASLALLGLSALSSSATIERALLGEASGKLSWGPTLFRALAAFHGLALCVWAVRLMRRRMSADVSRIDRHAMMIEAKVPERLSGPVILALVVTLVAALALRLWRLDLCLWFDEVTTVVDFLKKPMGEVVTSFPSQNQHMLYSVLGRVSFVLFGESAWAARLPAVFFGVGSIYALFLLGRRTSGTREALLASVLMTVFYYHIWFSQNARGYSGLLFFTLLATWLWLESLRCGTAITWAAYAASLSLGIWVHMTMLFVVAAHGVVFLSMIAQDWYRESARLETGGPQYAPQAIVAWFFAATVTLQLHALALPEFLRSALHEMSLQSEWTDPLWVVRESIQRLQDAGVVGVGAVVGMLALFAGWVCFLRRDWRIALLMVLPGILGGGAMLGLGHNLWPRFFFFCMGFALLIAVRGAFVTAGLLLMAIRDVNRRVAWTRRLGTLAVIVVILGSAATVPRCYAFPKQDFSGAKDFVESHRFPSDGVVAVGLASWAYQHYFAPQWSVAANESELAAIQAANERVWLVYTLPIQLRAWHPDVWEAVQSRFDEVKVFPGTLGDGQVVVCRWPKTEHPAQ